MTSRTIRTEQDLSAVIALLQARKLPMTVTVVSGVARSAQQNRTQQMWHLEAAEQLLDETAEDKRAFCKLHYGVPILRAEDEGFRDRYDAVFRPLDYEVKLALMAVPFDFPVTRLMTSTQKAAYLDRVWTHYATQGVRLTDPELSSHGWSRRPVARAA